MSQPAESLGRNQDRPALRIVQGRRNGTSAFRTRPQTGPELLTATVRGSRQQEDGRVVCWVEPIDTSVAGAEPSETMEALRAAGCLLVPSPGDLVLLMRHSGGIHYVLQILEQRDPASMLRFPGDLSLDVSQGNCSVYAQKLEVTGRESAAVHGREVTLAGEQGRMRFANLDVLAKLLEARIQRVHAFGECIRLAASQLTSRLGRVLRWTGYELHRARSVRTEVEERFTVQAGQADILAKDEVTVDAEKIHLG
ncbi:DUF3540 domain-containing protein [Desulfonatronum thioautotrophicum]|uniref:DUF3540 domain-containing protein n=1 Tax=Desulfonatronum thioautotrophicum TaxID=617001 RepID=UPI00137931F0|nr:DUF3540 domain-containing protein [Desulfonatronum thioautotrophicum]